MNREPLYATAELAADLNHVAEFLAASDFPERDVAAARLREVFGVKQVDALVLLGNSVLATSERALAAMQAGLARRLLISGGRGHSTSHLYQALAAHPRYRKIEPHNRSEAECLREVAVRFWGIDSALITLETESSNCGENAQFTRRTIAAEKLPAESLVLAQDPTMQRRSLASFQKAWDDAGIALKAANLPAFVPRVALRDERLAFPEDQPMAWEMERFVSLVLGEVPRLRDDGQGYGPRGRHYLVHVDIPESVLAAHARLAAAFPGLARGPWSGV